MQQVVEIEGKELLIRNLDKKFYPEGLTKADIIKYYVDIADRVLPYVQNRPLVMVRYPDGIEGKFFYQKDCPEHAPEWIRTVAIPSEAKPEPINFIQAADVATLVWMASQGNIEIHAWLSRVTDLHHPDVAIFDLDPAEGATFSDVVELALLVKGALEEFGIKGFPKTSGSTGIHINIPLLPSRFTYEDVREATGYISQLITSLYPQKATLERKVKDRAGKVYMDYLQNSWGKTMAWVYSLRPHPGAPVSTPVTWQELERGEVSPDKFNIHTIFSRLQRMGDLYADFWQQPQDLGRILQVTRRYN